ncbi:MAG: hypothetical protein DWI03_05245 [Planctomycetota bacterium]|nr:MAG: hypothetical protein DWI03_05245 [Planctomycetota bacterium]
MRPRPRRRRRPRGLRGRSPTARSGRAGASRRRPHRTKTGRVPVRPSADGREALPPADRPASLPRAAPCGSTG